MKRLIVLFAMCLLLSYSLLAADEVPLDMQGHRQFGKELVEKCLEMKHGEMLRCIKEGIEAVSGEDITVMDEEQVDDLALWEAPSEAREEANPYPRDADSVAKGGEFYRIQCSQCHGPAGRGDGPAAADFGQPMSDLAAPKTQERTDGELMWRITEGGWPMPAFGYQDEWGRDDLWHVINYLRTLSFEDGS